MNPPLDPEFAFSLALLKEEAWQKERLVVWDGGIKPRCKGVVSSFLIRKTVCPFFFAFKVVFVAFERHSRSLSGRLVSTGDLWPSQVASAL